MAIKTISLELDAYEKLRSAKRPGESFSAVVRRLAANPPEMTGARLLEFLGSGGCGVSEEALRSIEEADASDRKPEDPWA